MSKPKVYFDITIGGKDTGRVVFEVSGVAQLFIVLCLFSSKLFSDVVPKTAGQLYTQTTVVLEIYPPPRYS